jgi:shikimate kinase
MGVGKSTTAEQVAARLGWPWRDSDRDIETRTGRNGREIAGTDGVPALHELERAVLLDALASDEPTVITAAGSTIESAACRAALAARATVVWLTLDAPELAERIASGSHRRPMDRTELNELIVRRAPWFAATATLTIDASTALDAIVETIVEHATITAMAPHSWIDLVTLDTTNPRATARFWCAFVDLDVQLDEDVGRWVVLEDRTGHRVIGLQRSDARELANRTNGRLTLDVSVPPDLIEAETIRAVSLGAIAVADGLTDPDGTPFRLVPTDQPASSFDVATFDVLDPSSAAAFWIAATGLVTLESSEDHVVVGLPGGSRLLGFRGASADSLAARTRDRIHIDLECPLDVFDDEVNRLIDLGAVRLGTKRVEHFASGQIFTDPNGVVFCQNGYTESELASRTTPSVARGRHQLAHAFGDPAIWGSPDLADPTTRKAARR